MDMSEKEDKKKRYIDSETKKLIKQSLKKELASILSEIVTS